MLFARAPTFALCFALVARSATVRAAEPSSVEVPPASPAANAAPNAEPSFSFELLPSPLAVDPVAASQLQSQLALRRSLLEWHLALGFANVALLAATVVVGQLDYSDRFGGGPSTGQFEGWHTVLEGGATAVFASDALLALLAPVPIPKHGGFDTLTVHEIAMSVAAAGFVSEIPLGIYTVAREGHVDQGTFALVHLVIGYVTAGALAAGVGALAF